MVETAISGLHSPAPPVGPRPSGAGAPPPGPVNPDGSAVPDVIARHHRPEDIGDLSNQDVPAEGNGGGALFGADGLTFADVLDIVNPLQHIPIVSTIYRALTGDEISVGARVAGGALYGGPVGVAVAAVNSIVEAATGSDIGETVAALFTGDPSGEAAAATAKQASPGPVVAVADADPTIVGVGAPPLNLPSARKDTDSAPPRNDPVAAVLQARAAAPAAGSIRGLANTTRTRLADGASIPAISPRLSDKLTALAAQSAPAGAARPGGGSERRPYSATVPGPLVPQRMIDALDRYERMKRTAPPRG